MEVSPFINLWRAVIGQAVVDAVLDPNEESDALSWLLSDTNEPYSFLWAANEIGLSETQIAAVRQRVQGGE